MYIYAYRYIHINTHIRRRMMNGWVTARKRHLFVRTRVLDGGFYSQPSGNFPFVSFFLTLKQIAACPARMPKRSVSLQHTQLLAPRRLGQWSEIIAHTLLHKWKKKNHPLVFFFARTHTRTCADKIKKHSICPRTNLTVMDKAVVPADSPLSPLEQWLPIDLF